MNFLLFHSQQKATALFGEKISRQCCFFACTGAFIIGVTLPTLLILWHRGLTHSDRIMTPGWIKMTEMSFKSIIETALWLFSGVSVFCGPGTVLLSLLLYFILRKDVLSQLESSGLLLLRGAMLGAVLAFANQPGWSAWQLFTTELWNPQPPALAVRAMVILRFVLLFSVTGASCGAWIAWQAYRSHHPSEGQIPKYSLRTMMMLVLLWGALLALFSPRK